jgi:Protein of unknown function (DUF2815)
MSAPEIIFAQNVRLSFPHLVEAHKSKIAAPTAVAKFSADFLLPQDHPALAQFMARYTEMAQQKWAEHATTVMQMIQADRKLRCYGPGSEKIDKKTFKPYSGYDGMYFISASRETPPQMIRADGSAVDAVNTMEYQANARKMYGGCYVNVALHPWIQENTFGRGIRCDLVAIQFAKDGEAFGEGVVDASNMFGAVAAPVAPATAPAFAMPGLPNFL